MESYHVMVRHEIARQGHIGVSPRHVLGFMYLVHSTLDGLTKGQFQQEVATGIQCVLEGGTETAESCALSFAL